MLNRSVILVAALSFALSVPVLANPTGAPLLTYPVEPCRVLDTRPFRGPLAGQAAMNVFVRGSLLDPLDGAAQSDCKVPPEAEAVVVNVVAVSPTATSVLKINGTGFVFGPNGVYSRLNYRYGQNTANEMTISLCNAFLSPAPHQPCYFDGAGRYSDFQVLNGGPIGTTVHLVADVVAYLAP